MATIRLVESFAVYVIRREHCLHIELLSRWLSSLSCPLCRAFQQDLDRAQPGTSRHVTQRQNPIPSKSFPVSLRVRPPAPHAPCSFVTKTPHRDYGNLIDTFRPGHADYTYWHKYWIRDHRGGGRASARGRGASGGSGDSKNGQGEVRVGFMATIAWPA